MYLSSTTLSEGERELELGVGTIDTGLVVADPGDVWSELVVKHSFVELLIDSAILLQSVNICSSQVARLEASNTRSSIDLNGSEVVVDNIATNKPGVEDTDIGCVTLLDTKVEFEEVVDRLVICALFV